MKKRIPDVSVGLPVPIWFNAVWKEFFGHEAFLKPHYIRYVVKVLLNEGLLYETLTPPEAVEIVRQHYQRVLTKA